MKDAEKKIKYAVLFGLGILVLTGCNSTKVDKPEAAVEMEKLEVEDKLEDYVEKEKIELSELFDLAIAEAAQELNLSRSDSENECIYLGELMEDAYGDKIREVFSVSLQAIGDNCDVPGKWQARVYSDQYTLYGIKTGETTYDEAVGILTQNGFTCYTESEDFIYHAKKGSVGIAIVCDDEQGICNYFAYEPEKYQ